MNIAVCDFDLLVEAAFGHGGFVSETPKFLRGLRRNYTRKIECRSLIYFVEVREHTYIARTGVPLGHVCN